MVDIPLMLSIFSGLIHPFTQQTLMTGGIGIQESFVLFEVDWVVPTRTGSTKTNGAGIP